MVFALARHPVSWYRSYWSFKTETGWRIRFPFDRQFAYDDFPSFASAVMREHPGWLSKMLHRYTTTESGDAVDCIGKLETVADDFVRFLRLAGEDFDETAIRETPPQNVTENASRWRERTLLDAPLIAAIEEAERPIMERFGYASFSDACRPVSPDAPLAAVC